ncbi:uncharacterized protein LOC110998043 [Pieris rapae]|uniref:uncharacterized protein LOC110998043 n=1 Tax=Pieris rapae TaxID=64459 RepID=UPI001E27AC87|nr:uncharacterized protein LOC110998043 [Pieris rapae]
MKSVKKLLSEKAEKKHGLYVHYSPPKALGAIPASDLRQWVRAGQEGKLERAVLNGQGRRLLSEAENLPLSRYLVNLINKCVALHAAVETGSLLDLQELLESDYNRNKLSSCCDDAGVGLLHKAVYYNYTDIVEYLVKYYPHLVHLKDSEGRIALHYTAACRDEAQLSALLLGAGAARGARDAAGHTLAHYRTARTKLTLPAAVDMPTRPGMVIKRHNIRIWCHECDMGRLQRVIWEGQGSRLLSEVSSQPIVKKFLETVPYMMNTIKDIHNAVIQNDLENVIKLTSSPVPPQILSSKDPNNMTVFHKAAGLGHCGILNYIVERYPQGINEIDNEGRTPLHYAAIVKDDKHTFKTVIGFGADESAVDNRNKTPAYYLNRPQEIDKHNLKVLPEAPRTPSSAYPASWDWKILDTDYTAELNKKPRRKNFKTSSENISSKNTLSESTENINHMKNSSTHEMINSLPELNDKHETIQEEKINNITENFVLHESEQVSENVEQEACFGENQDYKGITSGDDKIEDTLKETNKSDSRPNSQNGLDPQNEHTNLDQPEKEENNVEEVNDLNTAITKSESKVFNSEDLNQESVPLPVLPVLPVSPINKSINNADTDTDDKINKEVITENESCTQIDILENKNNENMPESTHSQEGNVEKHNDDHISQNDIESNQPNDSFEDINAVQKEAEPKLLKVNGATEIQNKMEYHNSDEEVTTVSDDEGNTKVDTIEDDDDVQVQDNTQTAHNDTYLQKELHKNGSAIRSDRVPSGTSHEINNGRNSQESLIEGIVSSEAEKDSQDASIIKGNSVHGDLLVIDNQIDPEVTELINTVNLEMLATLVLNGEGSRLIGRYSDNLELQAFLDNVPSYMHKINKVHLAAKEGNIRDLQAALDRRKFAIARDPISANGATPLHVATVFGKTNIIKYLGGRFPETLSAVDFEGRTALHYAAVLPDNGHYYNLLQQLGSNSKDLDDNGRSADDYYRNPNLLPFSQLLSDFGISDDEIKEMFSDQGVNHASNGQLDIPIFQTEEGRYLAKSLGDPLIKGLTEVANAKPKDPIAFLATFLHNFPDHEKPQLGTQESNTLITNEPPEYENQSGPDELKKLYSNTRIQSARNRPTGPIEVITVDPYQAASPDAPEVAPSSAERDEHGQSMLHFAAARTHTNNALFQLLQETDVSIGYRDELYRTARDISIQANVLENTGEIDRFVLHLAARGNTDKIMELLVQGYDHILDVVDEEGVPINEVISQRGDTEMSSLMASIPSFEESRERLHVAVRRGDLSEVREILSAEGGKTLARAQNSYGRTPLHAAVLAQNEEIVGYLAETFPELLKIGDTLERTPLHYAMGVEKMESLSRILTRAGAKRVLKDLKGRQPTYYYMNKSDILRLKEEEEMY